MHDNPSASVGEKARRFRRFKIQHPVLVQYQTGGTTVEVEAVSKNVSIGGLIMSSAIVIPLRTRVSFEICIPKGKRARNIHLAGEGRVVRVERAKKKGEVTIAVECDVPLTHLARGELLVVPGKIQLATGMGIEFCMVPGVSTDN